MTFEAKSMNLLFLKQIMFIIHNNTRIKGTIIPDIILLTVVQ